MRRIERVFGSAEQQVCANRTAAGRRAGAAGYFTAFACATFAAFGYLAARRFYALTVAAMFLSTLWFLYVQAFLLHAYCRYCLFSAAVTFLLAGCAVAMPLPKRQPTP